MDQTSQPSSSSAVCLGGRAIDRHNPIIHDGRRFTPPPSPSPKLTPIHHYQTQKTKLGLDHEEKSEEETKKKSMIKRKKNKKGFVNGNTSPEIGFISTTPPGSSRYLLGDPVSFDGFVDSDPVPVPVDPVDELMPDFAYHEDRLIINASKRFSSSSFLEKKQPDFFDGFLDYEPVLSPDNSVSPPKIISPSESYREDKEVTATPDARLSPPPEKKSSLDQVVVLRVSLHCKGCAGKVRKHLSRMKGVTSFNVDFTAKKVTVTGDVTPLSVLATVSKVKNAQFWPEIKK